MAFGIYSGVGEWIQFVSLSDISEPTFHHAESEDRSRYYTNGSQDIITYKKFVNILKFAYYLIAYLLTHSMEQSPSWEANQFAASQNIPRIL
jgi:hypothetical protein